MNTFLATVCYALLATPSVDVECYSQSVSLGENTLVTQERAVGLFCRGAEKAAKATGHVVTSCTGKLVKL